MVSVSQILAELRRYLNGQTDIDQLDEWVTGNTWNVHRGGDKRAESLTAEIELRLGEYGIGHLPEEQLRTELATFLTPAIDASGTASFGVGVAAPIRLLAASDHTSIITAGLVTLARAA